MKVLILKVFMFLLNVIYTFFKLLKTQKKVVMISRQSNEINDDFLLLGKEFEKQGFKIVYLCRTLDGGVNSTVLTKILYGFHLFTQMFHLATSEICILDTYCLTVSILNHKKSLKIVQIWHSIGTLKQFGWQIAGSGEGSSKMIAETMKMHKNYDVIYCAGNAYKDFLAEGFGVSADKIRIFTLPRIDLLKSKEYTDKTKLEITEKYPVLKEKENVVYAPTFRKDDSEFNKYFENLVKEFDFDKYNLIVKLHPLSKTEVNDSRVIVDKVFTTFQMLCCADKLISDYSCIVYEAGVINIPLYFYNFDFDIYADVRGLTINYDELPGFKSRTAKELVESLEKTYDYDCLKSYINKYVENTEDCAKKMVEDIINFEVQK